MPTIAIISIFTFCLVYFFSRRSIKTANDALHATNAWCDAKEDLEKYLDEHPHYRDYSEDLLDLDETFVILRKRVSKTHVEFIKTHRYFGDSYIIENLPDLEPEDQDHVLNLLLS